VIPYEVPGLSGLELWDGLSRGASLYRLRESKRDYFEALRDFLLRLHAGTASTEDAHDTENLARAARFERVLFCGGEALHPLLEGILADTPLPFCFEIDRIGEFAARRGALRIFREMGWRRGVALDLGQTQLKVITASACRMIARDPHLLPVGFDSLDPAAGLARLRDLLRQGLSNAESPMDGVVLALPVALDQNGSARPATYPGLSGPVEPLFADLFRTPWVVLNDAVLAAAGFPPAKHEKTVVITMGFGLGGALWEG